MVGPGLKLRYIFAVLTVGALLTTTVAMVTHYSESAERDELRAVAAQLDSISVLDPRIAATHERLQALVDKAYDERTVNIAVAGTLLTLMAGLIVMLLMVRIDRALISLMKNARSIGRGSYAEPVAVSGVAEVAALERSIEQMRQALTTTTISRDFLDDVLNGIKDAVLVMTTDGRMRTANAAAARLFGLPEQDLIGVAFKDLIAPEHLAASTWRLRSAPGGRARQAGGVPMLIVRLGKPKPAATARPAICPALSRHARQSGRRHPLPGAQRRSRKMPTPSVRRASCRPGVGAQRRAEHPAAHRHRRTFKEIDDVRRRTRSRCSSGVDG